MYEMELPLRSSFFSSSQRSYHSQVAPEEMLLRWVNYHLRRSGCNLTLTNFSDDIMVELTPFRLHSRIRLSIHTSFGNCHHLVPILVMSCVSLIALVYVIFL